jgi:hypothetical protein
MIGRAGETSVSGCSFANNAALTVACPCSTLMPGFNRAVVNPVER